MRERRRCKNWGNSQRHQRHRSTMSRGTTRVPTWALPYRDHITLCSHTDLEFKERETSFDANRIRMEREKDEDEAYQYKAVLAARLARGQRVIMHNIVPETRLNQQPDEQSCPCQTHNPHRSSYSLASPPLPPHPTQPSLPLLPHITQPQPIPVPRFFLSNNWVMIPSLTTTPHLPIIRISLFSSTEMWQEQKQVKLNSENDDSSAHEEVKEEEQWKTEVKESLTGKKQSRLLLYTLATYTSPTLFSLALH